MNDTPQSRRIHHELAAMLVAIAALHALKVMI